MTDTRGTFRLHTVRQNVLNNEYVSIPAVWVKPDAADNAYVGGGSPTDSRFDKITFATDGISNVASANLNHGGGREAGVFSSSSAGYFAAGNQGTPSSTSFDRRSYVRKLTYASETISNLSNPINHSPSGSGQGPRGGGGAMSATDGYVMGGSGQAGGDERSWISKLAFSSETWSAPPNLPSAVQDQGDALGNLDAGYLAGGTPGNRTLVQKITYASDTTSRSPSSDLPNPSRTCAAAGNATAGFIMARQGTSTYDAHSSIFKFTYASGTASVLPSNMGIALRTTSGTGNLTKGYVSGGYQSSGHDWSGVQKLTYETGTGSRNGSLTLGTARQVLAVSARDHGASGEGTLERWFDSKGQAPDVGYVTMGQGSPGGALRSSTEKLDMTTDTSMSQLPGGNAPFPGMQGGCSFGNDTDGITATGGNQPDMSTDYTYVNKFTYSTETFSSLSGYPGSETAEGRGYAAGSTGYYVGGFVNMSGPADLSSVNKFAFASDTWSESPSPLNDARYWFANIQNETEGWALGGYHPSKTTSEKITFSTDTWSSESSTLPSDAKTYYIGGNGSGDATAGYWAGGHPSPGSNKVWKLVYATGTVSNEFDLTPSSPSDNWTLNTGMANETKGYFAGGLWSQGQTEVCKFPYATETASNINPGMTQNRQGAFSFGPRKLGSIVSPPTATPTASTFPSLNPALNVNAVFASGQSPSATVNTRSKFTFSNETMASMPAFSDKITVCGGASSTTRGYLSGGFGNTSQGDTQNKRWYNQYSNDTSALLPSRTSQNAGGMYSMNDETKLYSGGGGWSSGQHNTAESMPFANETNTGEPGMTLTSPKKYASGIGNKTIGFVCGGNEGNNNRTTIDKVVYSTGTMSTSPSNLTLSGASPYHATMAVGNTTTGFIFQSSPTNKLVFATETVSSAPNNNTATSWGNATSSATTGYCMNYPSGQYLIKYVFSTETTGTLPSMFSPNRSRGGAMSTAMFGGAYTSVPNVI